MVNILYVHAKRERELYMNLHSKLEDTMQYIHNIIITVRYISQLSNIQGAIL